VLAATATFTAVTTAAATTTAAAFRMACSAIVGADPAVTETPANSLSVATLAGEPGVMLAMATGAP
jgi:hypothetical protein